VSRIGTLTASPGLKSAAKPWTLQRTYLSVELRKPCTWPRRLYTHWVSWWEENAHPWVWAFLEGFADFDW
jgi:hypothetical protein